MRVLFRILANFVRLLVWPLNRWRRNRLVPAGAYVHLEIEGAVPSVAAPRTLLQLARKPPMTVHGLSELVDAILDDPRPRGLLVTLRSLRTGMATATSIREELRRLRDAGREVVVHLPLGGDTREYYVATAASRIFVGPRTSLAPLGFAINARYYREALAKAGLEPEVFARGTYKSAGEAFVRDEMSAPHKEQMDAVLDTFYDELVEAVAEGRHLDPDTARAAVDDAPFQPQRAIERGLVDGSCYEDELEEALDGAEFVPAGKYLRARTSGRLVPVFARTDVVGVIRVDGAIASGSASPFPLAVDEPIVHTIRRARKDPRVRAVVLHVDSPGGSALASDRIHHELVRLAAEKPLVACMGNVAASGGYYVAAPAHAIVAQPTTITGSIGVIAARFSAEQLMERLGVHVSHLRRGKNVGLVDPSGPLSESERAALHRELEETYQGFVQVVADGRKLSLDETHALAEGRVWIGRDARRKGLVDEFGGLTRALRLARDKAALPIRAPMVVLRPPRSRVPPFSAEHRARRVARVAGALLETLGIDPSHVGGLALAASRERALMLFPLGDSFR